MILKVIFHQYILLSKYLPYLFSITLNVKFTLDKCLLFPRKNISNKYLAF